MKESRPEDVFKIEDATEFSKKTISNNESSESDVNEDNVVEKENQFDLQELLNILKNNKIVVEKKEIEKIYNNIIEIKNEKEIISKKIKEIEEKSVKKTEGKNPQNIQQTQKNESIIDQISNLNVEEREKEDSIKENINQIFKNTKNENNQNFLKIKNELLQKIYSSETKNNIENNPKENNLKQNSLENVEADKIEQQFLEGNEADKVQQNSLENVEADKVEQQFLEGNEADKVQQNSLENIESDRVEEEFLGNIENESVDGNEVINEFLGDGDLKKTESSVNDTLNIDESENNREDLSENDTIEDNPIENIKTSKDDLNEDGNEDDKNKGNDLSSSLNQINESIKEMSSLMLKGFNDLKTNSESGQKKNDIEKEEGENAQYNPQNDNTEKKEQIKQKNYLKEYRESLRDGMPLRSFMGVPVKLKASNIDLLI